MFLFESGEGHEPTGQIIGYLDDILYNFFFKLYSKNFASNTSIILFSDPTLFLIFSNTQELYEEFLYEKIKSNQ